MDHSADYHAFHKQVKPAGLLIAIGIVFGDIGTSPLYTLNALFHEGEVVSPAKALGIFSCIIWDADTSDHS